MKQAHGLALAILATFVLSGCASDNAAPGPGAASGSDFDKVKDPPVTAETYYASGQFAESQGEKARAIAQYQQAVKLKKGYVPALYRIGVLETEAKNWPAATDAWKKYVEATRGSGRAWSNLAFCYQLQGKDAQAAEAYLKGIEKEPSNVAVRTNYGLMLARQGKDQEAIKQWSVVLSPAEVKYNMGSVYEQRGEISQARDAYRAALKLDPALQDARKRLAELDRN